MGSECQDELMQRLESSTSYSPKRNEGYFNQESSLAILLHKVEEAVSSYSACPLKRTSRNQNESGQILTVTLLG